MLTMEWFIKYLIFIHLNKMVLLKRNINILDMVRTIMIHVRIPTYLWLDAILCACHLIRQIALLILWGKTPFWCYFPNKALSPLLFPIFGCLYFVQDLSLMLDKFSPFINVYLWAIRILKKAISAINLYLKNILLLQISYYLSLFPLLLCHLLASYMLLQFLVLLIAHYPRILTFLESHCSSEKQKFI